MKCIICKYDIYTDTKNDICDMCNQNQIVEKIKLKNKKSIKNIKRRNK